MKDLSAEKNPVALPDSSGTAGDEEEDREAKGKEENLFVRIHFSPPTF